MYVYGQGDKRIGSPWRARDTSSGRRRAGWWFWFPFLFGAFFTVGGVAGIAGSTAFGAGAGGLGIAGAIWLVIGVLSLLGAWYAWRDIHSDDAPPEIPGNPVVDLDAQLRVTGVPGHAVITNFKYLSGSSHAGSTLVELNLDLTTTLGGSIPLVQQTRVPLALTDKLVVGASVPVLVSSTDPSKMVIEWTGFVGPPATPPAAAAPAPTPPAAPAPAPTPPAPPPPAPATGS
jgi:hypothetical protein